MKPSISSTKRTELAKTCIEIGKRRIGPGNPAYCIAEVSANHNQDYDQAVRIIRAAKDAGTAAA